MLKKVSALALALFASAAIAQSNYPNRPVTWVVPFAAGWPTDALARSIADVTSKQLGQSIIIDNVPGAGGTIYITSNFALWMTPGSMVHAILIKHQ